MNRFAARIPKLLRRLRREDGLTMVATLGMSMALGATVTGTIAYSSTNSRNAYVTKADQVALALAEAGVNNALAAIENPANDPMDPTLLTATSADYEGGRATWWGTLDRANAMWTVTAKGEATNPTSNSARPLTRVVTMNVKVNPAPAQTPQTRMWDYMVATRTGNTCDVTLNSTVAGGSPLYVFGNLCVASGAKVTGGPLAVKGNLTLSASDSTVGTSASYIDAAHISGWCKWYNQAAHSPCTAADRVYANTITQSPPALTVPTPAWSTWYDHAAPGPKHNCATASGTVPVFDNNSVRDRSVTTVFNLTPTTSYTCRVGRAADPIGELSRDAATRTLTVHGTIFIDGSAKVDNGLLNTYVGRGSLYLSGTFNALGSTKLCAVAAGTECDFTSWDPSTKFFAIVANGNGGSGLLSGNSVQIGCFDRFQGGLFATHAVQFASGAKHQGPIIASNIVLGSSVTTYPFTGPELLPAGMPGSGVVYSETDPPDNYSD